MTSQNWFGISNNLYCRVLSQMSPSVQVCCSSTKTSAPAQAKLTVYLVRLPNTNCSRITLRTSDSSNLTRRQFSCLVLAPCKNHRSTTTLAFQFRLHKTCICFIFSFWLQETLASYQCHYLPTTSNSLGYEIETEGFIYLGKNLKQHIGTQTSYNYLPNGNSFLFCRTGIRGKIILISFSKNW